MGLMTTPFTAEDAKKAQRDFRDFQELFSAFPLCPLRLCGEESSAAIRSEYIDMLVASISKLLNSPGVHDMTRFMTSLHVTQVRHGSLPPLGGSALKALPPQYITIYSYSLFPPNKACVEALFKGPLLWLTSCIADANKGFEMVHLCRL